MGMKNPIPNFRERECDVVIPGNDRERERECPQKIGSNFIFCCKNKRRLLYQISSQTLSNTIKLHCKHRQM